MNPNDFEKRLQRQSLRPIPADWREEILAAARGPKVRASNPITFRDRLSALLWPCPQAWAGLAAVWIFILAVCFADGGESGTVATQPPPPPALILVLKEQRQGLAQFFEIESPAVRTPKAYFLRPRSEGPSEAQII
jgi:hypothetical protein